MALSNLSVASASSSKTLDVSMMAPGSFHIPKPGMQPRGGEQAPPYLPGYHLPQHPGGTPRQRGANLADKEGLAPLHVAARLGNVEAAIILLERDAIIDAIEKNGYSARHITTREGQSDFVEFSLKDGADIDVMDGEGRGSKHQRRARISTLWPATAGSDWHTQMVGESEPGISKEESKVSVLRHLWETGALFAQPKEATSPSPCSSPPPRRRLSPLLLTWPPCAEAQLQESLDDTELELKRSQVSRLLSERNCEQLEVQLDKLQYKYNSVFAAKLKLESNQLELECQIRVLHYQLNQEREARKTSEGLHTHLTEQFEKVKEQLSHEMTARHQARLERKELEVEHQLLKIANKQLEEAMKDLVIQMQKERDARVLQEGLYMKRLSMCQDLQEESKKDQEQRIKLLIRLRSADSSRQALEERIAELQKHNTQLQEDLVMERKYGEEDRSHLEIEVDALNEQLQARTESQEMAEEALMEAQRDFEAHLSELNSEVELLASTLDAEVAQRKSAEKEVACLQSQVEHKASELNEMARKKAKEEQQLWEKLEESTMETSVVEEELSSARESLQEVTMRVESLEQKLAEAESNGQEYQAQLLERANQVAEVQRELEQCYLQQHDSQKKEQVASLRSQVEHKASELNEMAWKKAEEQQQVWDKPEEATRETSVVEEELSSARESLQEVTVRVESLEQKLAEAESNGQEYEAQLLERANQVAEVQRDLEQCYLQQHDSQKKEQVASLQLQVEHRESELNEMAWKKAEEQQQVWEKLEEATKETSMVEGELSSARESLQEVTLRVESLEQKLAEAESNGREYQAQLLERANQVAEVQRELEQCYLQQHDSQKKEQTMSILEERLTTTHYQKKLS